MITYKSFGVRTHPVQVKEAYGNLDMVTCRLSSCNSEYTKYIDVPVDNACEGVRQYIDRYNVYFKTYNLYQ